MRQLNYAYNIGAGKQYIEGGIQFGVIVCIFRHCASGGAVLGVTGFRTEAPEGKL